MSHNFQICPIDFALHGDNVPYNIFAFKITDKMKQLFKQTIDLWPFSRTMPQRNQKASAMRCIRYAIGISSFLEYNCNVIFQGGPMVNLIVMIFQCRGIPTFVDDNKIKSNDLSGEKRTW